MAGTVTGTIGNNTGVYFTYQGTGAALHLDLGFQPSMMAFQAATATHTEWQWNKSWPYANIATINGWVPDTTGGVGRTIGTVTSTASVQGVQIGTDTTVNTGLIYNGYAFR